MLGNKTLQTVTVGILFSIIVGGIIPAHAATTNLQLAGTGDFQVEGNYAVFLVSESDQGSDLNGDGDTGDEVLYLRDIAGGITTNLGLDSDSPSFDGSFIVFRVNEANQGGTDLNSDGDAVDNVLHVHDIAGGITTNLGFASGSHKIDGNHIAFLRAESGDGVDFNLDGDTSDVVLHVYDIAGASTTNSGYAASQFNIDGNFVAFGVYESLQGATDLNGDGDATDLVLHVYDIGSSTTDNSNLSLFNEPKIEGNNVVFRVSENSEGSTDLNGDGDTADFVLHVYDVIGKSSTNVQLTSNDFKIIGSNVSFTVDEANQGATDLNSDGDTLDDVIYVYDIVGGISTNIGIATSINFEMDGDNLVFTASESSQGSDFNSDGDTNDDVIHLYQIAGATLTNIGLDTGPNRYSIDGNNISIRVSEGGQGSTDFNSDGDTLDNVLHVHDIAANITTNVGLDLDNQRPWVSGNHVVAIVPEAGQGNTDLNGDGDTSDVILHTYVTGTGVITDTGISSWWQDLDGNNIIFLVEEQAEGNTDLNSDGDTLDLVVHINEISSLAQTEQATGQVEVAQTCGLSIVAGNPLDYGSILPGDESAEQTMTLDNTGNTDLTTLLVRGTDWVDGSTTTQMTVDNTKFSTTSGTYASKTALSTTDQSITGSFSASTNLDTFWQLQVNLLDSAFSGPLTQTLELTVTC